VQMPGMGQLPMREKPLLFCYSSSARTLAIL
jgi:hypothetical protein